MKRTLTLLWAIVICFSAKAQIFGPGHHMLAYFTRPVDTSVARGQKAVALIRTAGDTVISYIDRAKYTLDVLMYDFVEDSTWFEHGNIPNIAAAIDRAYARGVKIRWICNQIDSVYSPNTGLDSINKAIPVLHSPTGPNYGIMHCKVMIIDGKSSNPNDAIVWTGCMNWEPGQIDKDANNLIIIQDSALAHGYLWEFNQMWGDTVEGGTPNLTNSKFGPYKKTIPKHNYTIDGSRVEVYFSPTDTLANHINATIASAKSEVDIGIFEFSYNPIATQVESTYKSGVYLTMIMDQYSTSYTPFSTLSPVMGSALEVYFGTDSLFHNKYIIKDPCNMKAGPAVLTGSHNWSTAAEQKNDENTVIIHDSTMANLFYQAYYKEYYSLGGTLIQHCVPLAINNLPDIENTINLFPIPATNYLTIGTISNVIQGTYKIYDVFGREVAKGKLDKQEEKNIDISNMSSGMYLLVIDNGNTQVAKKFLKQ